MRCSAAATTYAVLHACRLVKDRMGRLDANILGVVSYLEKQLVGKRTSVCATTPIKRSIRLIPLTSLAP